MDFVKGIRRFRKKIRPVGEQLEKGRSNNNRVFWKNLAVKIAIFAVLVAVSFAAFPSSETYTFSVEVGDIWRHETLEAPYDFAIYKDGDVIEAERRNVRYSTPPFFSEVPDAKQRMAAKRDTVSQQLDQIFEAYRSRRMNLLRDSLTWAEQDASHIADLKKVSWLILTPYQWNELLASYEDYIVADSAGLTPRPVLLHETLLDQAWGIGNQLINVGILDVALDSVFTEEIYIRRDEESIVLRRNKSNVFGLNEAFVFAQEQFSSYYTDSPQLASLGSAFFRAIFQYSLRFMRAESHREWSRREQRISPTRGMVSAGQVIVENGETVTEEIERRLSSLETAQRDRSGTQYQWEIVLGQLVLAFCTFLFFFLYLYVLRRPIFDDNRQVLLIALLFIGIIGSYAFGVRSSVVSMYAIPVAVVPVMITVMFDSRVAIFGLLTLAFIGGHFMGYDFEFTFATFFAGTLGIFSVRDIKNRGQIFLSAAIVALGYALVLGAGWLIYDIPWQTFSSDFLWAMVNSAQLIVVLPLLWVFERAFDMTTDLTLLELSDTNRPLIKELSLRAPGTFNHSLQVANLAEAAADAIGANALLARVGALYHDIGKMTKPEYFVENQRAGLNPHNQLKPRMSALIIANHVKEGLEIGRNYNLPKRVLDFIPMHHGTSLIEYFYRKAEEAEEAEQSTVLESEFRYPGPRPNTPEAGILMLADSVEAASRSITEPTHKRLETLIDAIFKSRVNDGQLDDTDLTFKDLHIIKETFLGMLIGIHHGRVKYPDQEKEIENDSQQSGAVEKEAPTVNGDGSPKLNKENPANA